MGVYNSNTWCKIQELSLYPTIMCNILFQIQVLRLQITEMGKLWWAILTIQMEVAIRRPTSRLLLKTMDIRYLLVHYKARNRISPPKARPQRKGRTLLSHKLVHRAMVLRTGIRLAISVRRQRRNPQTIKQMARILQRPIKTTPAQRLVPKHRNLTFLRQQRPHPINRIQGRIYRACRTSVLRQIKILRILTRMRRDKIWQLMRVTNTSTRAGLGSGPGMVPPRAPRTARERAPRRTEPRCQCHRPPPTITTGRIVETWKVLYSWKTTSVRQIYCKRDCFNYILYIKLKKI